MTFFAIAGISIAISCFLLAVLLCSRSWVHAAVGDVVADCADVLTTASQTIQPSSGDEWVIHMVSFEVNSVYATTDGSDSTNISPSDWIGPDHYLFNPAIHLTNGFYLTATNQSAGTGTYCYFGIKTKE